MAPENVEESGMSPSFAEALNSVKLAHEREVLALRERIELLASQVKAEPPSLNTGRRSVSSSAGLHSAGACGLDSQTSIFGTYRNQVPPSQIPIHAVVGDHAGRRKSIPKVLRNSVCELFGLNQKRKLGDSDSRWLARIANSPRFELFFAAAICCMAFAMCIQSQYDGLQVAAKLGFYGKEEAPPPVGRVFEVVNWFFAILFAIELVTKLFGLRFAFCNDMWNWVDFVLVISSPFILMQVSTFDPQLLRLIRIAKLGRLLRLVRNIRGFDALYILMTTLANSLSILTWTFMLLALIQIFTALVLNQALHEYYFSEEAFDFSEREQVYVYFGTFARSCLSMFEVTLGNWPPVVRLLTEFVHPIFMVFGIIHKLTIGFAVIGVINGVFMQETFKSAATDDVIMTRTKKRATRAFEDKIKRLFEHADLDASGSMSLLEFRNTLENPTLRAWLGAMEIDTRDINTLFTLIGEGRDVTCETMTSGLGKLRGPARSLDLAALNRDFRALHREMLEYRKDLLASAASIAHQGDRSLVEREPTFRAPYGNLFV